MNRICIIGNAGSGKSTLAHELGKALSTPVYHLDRYLLKNNFEKVPRNEYHANHASLVAGDTWIIDGNYKSLFGKRIARSTLVVFLDVSRAITIARVFRRLRNGGHPAYSVPDGARIDRVSWEFFKWTAGYNRRKYIKKLQHDCLENGVPLVILKNAPIERWVQVIKNQLDI